MKYWLMKSEPDVFGVDHLARASRRTTAWEGVRNYQARNMLRDDFRKGDLAFFYHSSCAVPGIAGIVEVVREGYPDPTQFDRDGEYYDAASTREAPRWFCVDVRLERRLEPVITLPELREHASRALRDMVILKRGNRLSVTPVTAAEWRCIVALRD
jgi:predicted RNA-binding protein with PUA-like domain